jgi:hypothetical protein
MHYLLSGGAILGFQIRAHRFFTVLMLISLPSQVFMRISVLIGINLMKRRTRLSLLVEFADQAIKLLHLKLIFWISKFLIDLYVLGSTDLVVVHVHRVCKILILPLDCLLSLRDSFWLCLFTLWSRLFGGALSSLLGLGPFRPALGPLFGILLIDLKHLFLWFWAEFILLWSTVFFRFHLNTPLRPNLLRGLGNFRSASRFQGYGFNFTLGCCWLLWLRLSSGLGVWI